MANLALFAVTSLVWGLTWAAIAIGLGAGLPPVLLAALRYLLTAALLAFFWRAASAALQDRRTVRTIASALLVNAGTYGLIFWGMQSVPSGLSGLVNLSLVPIFLFALAAGTGEEQPTIRHGVALLVGIAGLVALFWTRLNEDGGTSAAGLAAIVLGTASYCAGSVIARPLVGPVRPVALTFVQAAIGGVALLLVSAVLGEWSELDIASIDPAGALASLGFLAILGTILAYTLYLRLLRVWGTARAGLYAFVSPIVALLVGAYAFSEAIGAVEIVGAVALLCAAAVAISGQGTSKRRVKG